MAEEFGAWLLKIRNRLGISQEEMAGALRLDSRQTVGKYESSASRPEMSGASLEALLALLDFDRVAQLDHLWRSGQMPDIDRIRQKLNVPLPGFVSESAEAKARQVWMDFGVACAAIGVRPNDALVALATRFNNADDPERRRLLSLSTRKGR